jgi:hypothetical protein
MKLFELTVKVNVNGCFGSLNSPFSDETLGTNGTLRTLQIGILITLKNNVFETVFFIVNHVLKVPIVPKVPLVMGH